MNRVNTVYILLTHRVYIYTLLCTIKLTLKGNCVRVCNPPVGRLRISRMEEGSMFTCIKALIICGVRENIVINIVDNKLDIYNIINVDKQADRRTCSARYQDREYNLHF